MLVAAFAAALLLVSLAACGSKKAAGVTPAPSAGLTAPPSTSATAAPTTTTTPTTSTTVKPPPALANKPAVAVPKGAAPKSLVVKDLIKGTGKAAKSGDNVTVNYVGVLYSNGKEFDSSWKTGNPFSFQLGQGSVIKGWDQGVPGMHVGGRRELIIPANLAYGSAGQASIPPNSTLVFVVDLLSTG
jgi:peptidylprolyl isomerase